MALSPSPTSPLAGAYRNQYGNRSPSPPQLMSKKDKKRSQYIALGQELMEDFKKNRESQYRQQLVALQNDMNLIADVDVYKAEQIADAAEDINKAAEQINPYQSDLSGLAGKWYSTFIQEVNEAKEAKELNIITTTNNHEKKLKRVEEECDYKMHLAATEYDHMVGTLRERLTNQLNSKRQRLLKEKEQLDIADTNALLLHPSQFTITNPASPAGQTSRKTRTTRRGEQDDLNGLQDPTNKRKRKFVEDDVGSPVRNGTATPAGRGGRLLDTLAHQTAPLYSITNLFTEKELNFQSHQAQIAARHFFSTSQNEIDTNSRSKRGKEDGDAGPSNDNTDDEDDELEAPGMERSASQNVHVTRSRNVVGINAVHIHSELAEKTATRPPLPYATLHSHQQKSGTFLPQASRLLDSEIEEDLGRIIQIQARTEDALDEEAAEQAMAPTTLARSNLAPDWPAYLDIHLQEVDPRIIR